MEHLIMIAFKSRLFSRLGDKDLGESMYYNAFSARWNAALVSWSLSGTGDFIPLWPALGLWPWIWKPAHRFWPFPQFCVFFGDTDWGMQFYMILVFLGVFFLVWFTDVQTWIRGMSTTKWEIGNNRSVAAVAGPYVGNTADLVPFPHFSLIG